MPTATPAELRILGAYVAYGSTKLAAHSLGMSHEAYRARLKRLYRRHGVRNMGELWAALGSEASQTAGLYADIARASLEP